jgi:hypothetical protein
LPQSKFRSRRLKFRSRQSKLRLRRLKLQLRHLKFKSRQSKFRLRHLKFRSRQSKLRLRQTKLVQVKIQSTAAVFHPLPQRAQPIRLPRVSLQALFFRTNQPFFRLRDGCRAEFCKRSNRNVLSRWLSQRHSGVPWVMTLVCNSCTSQYYENNRITIEHSGRDTVHAERDEK